MSKNNNVNPDHYKVAGRARQGEGIVQDEERRTFAQRRRENASSQRRGQAAAGKTAPKKSR